MALRFGLGFPTCREGQTYPVPYVRPGELATVARRAEELGHHSLWGNDHLTTPRVIRATLEQPSNFYEPIVTFASLANVTERLRFMLSVLVLRLLFDRERADFAGRYLRFEDVDLAPKPVQRPFPILLSAGGPAGLRR